MNTFLVAFPHTITRQRTSPGGRDNTGVYQPGRTEAVEMAAKVQPVTLEDSDQLGGGRVVDRLKVFVPDVAGGTIRRGFSSAFSSAFFRGSVVSNESALSAAFEDSAADTVLYDGRKYTVIESQRWRGSHVMAVLLRET